MTTEVTLLKQYPLFSDLNEAQLHAVAQLCESECFYPNHTLFEEGQPGTRIFLLIEGEVELLFMIDEAGPTRIGLSKTGEIIGCPTLIPPYTHTATARSLTPIEVLAIDVVRLRELFKQDCALAVSILQHLIQALLDCLMDLRLATREQIRYPET
jgi:CRP/FNR family cyclic AMP-dependent transcriptional regulator